DAGAGRRLAVGRRHHRMCESVESLPARLRLHVNVPLELEQRAPVHLALEFDHRFERHPVVVPTPCIEFGMLRRAKGYVVVAAGEPQEVPDLFLPAVAAAPFALDPVRRDVVPQPVSRTAQDLHVVRTESDFLAQFPVHRLLGRFTGIDATLRKLPRVLADPFTPKYLVSAVDDDDGDVRAIAVTVEHRGPP